MKTGSRGIALIKRFEQCRLKAYVATEKERQRNIWTIGWGKTTGVREGDTCTQEQADEWFIDDLAKFEDGVNRLVTVPLTQPQFDALVSFAYNVGLDIDEDTKAEGLGDSTLLKLVNAGEFDQASKEFMKWVYQDGVKLNGLVARREAEKTLFETAV